MQGTVERWQLNYASGPGVHPAHIHLVNFQVVSRTGGLYPALPYETAGLKDVIFLQPGESVEVLAFYGPWNGMYMIHCRKSRSHACPLLTSNATLQTTLFMKIIS